MVNCNSQIILDLSKNIVHHCYTKYIDEKYHWLRDAVNTKEIELKKIHIDNNASDILIKIVT